MKKILIIEDEESIKKVLMQKFSNEGFQIISASNGEEGLELSLKEAPDLILLDIIMPRMDGLTMLKKLKATPEGKSIPVIILTNLSRSEGMEDSLKSGIYDFLIKSNWKIEELVDKVKECLQ